jgi:hypothetical protein
MLEYKAMRTDSDSVSRGSNPRPPATETTHEIGLSGPASEASRQASRQVEKPTKPLGGKAYGSIGHLPQSRLGPGDWHVHEGQARICLEKPRKGDRIIVCEKLDGACMSVANIDGEIVALTRAGYRATDGTFEHLRAFAPYVESRRERFAELLRPGERVAGEWLAMAHGTLYDPEHDGFAPFLAFDLFRNGKRVLRDEFYERTVAAGILRAKYIYDGPEGFSIEQALERLGTYGLHGALDPIEGAVWRVEREGRVDFLAKYVRPDKRDGIYLPNVSGGEAKWLWVPTPLPARSHGRSGR